ncbi:methyltransferase domain-containing protein [Thiohalophilus sp.]|uniref:methyltransferase domain-containing protein n=1 Tax=Thiohalophilus sp. TaxID=3028392 RepID=UPI00397636BA
MPDPHRFVNELDEESHERLIGRLESRAKVPVFANLFDKYVEQIDLPSSARILEVGCGTGVILRNLVQRMNFSGSATGVDQCKAFIDAANKYAEQESITAELDFQVGDIHNLSFDDAVFDLVIAHTVISHVTEPVQVLAEMARVVRPGGIVAIFDGDYASLTYAYPDHGFGQKMDNALATTTFNNPRIMRDLPRLLPDMDLELKSAWGDAVVEIGDGSYFKTFAETYVPYVKNAGLFSEQTVKIWLNEQYRAMENGTFFAACNYYTYLVRKVSGPYPVPTASV